MDPRYTSKNLLYRLQAQQNESIGQEFQQVQDELNQRPTSEQLANAPYTIQSLFARAYQDYIFLSIEILTGTDPSKGVAALVVQRSKDNGMTWYDIRGIQNGLTTVPPGDFKWPFDRDIDGFPEASGPAQPWPALDKYSFRVKAKNSAGTLSVNWCQSGAVSTLGYYTWYPLKPVGGSGASAHRHATVIVAPPNGVFGADHWEVQVEKGSGTVGYEPYMGTDIWQDESKWRASETPGGYVKVPTPLWETDFPLEGQSLGQPENTIYRQRFRLVTKRAWAEGTPSGYVESDGLTAGPWSDWIDVLAMATGAYDIVQKGVKTYSLDDLAVTLAKIAPESIDMTKMIEGIRPTRTVSTLPAHPYTGYDKDDTVVLSTDDKLYRLTDPSGTGTSGWSTAVSASDIAGQIQAAQIAALEASKITGQLSDSQLAAIAAAKVTGQLVGTQITDGAISTPKIAAGAVEAGKIASGAVTTEKLYALAVTAAKIAAGAVEAAKIATGAVETEKLAAGAVIADKIAANAVTAVKIATDAVEAGKIKAGAVTTDKLDALSVTAAKIAAGAVVVEKLAASAVTADKIAAGAVLAEKLSVQSRNYINNPTATQNIKGWGNIAEDGSGSSSYLSYDATEKALRIRTSGNYCARTKTYQIDHNKIYKIQLRVKKSLSHGTWYLGLSGYTGDTLGYEGGGNGQGSLSFQGINKDTRANEGSPDVNFYFTYGTAPTAYTTITVYIVGAYRDVNEFSGNATHRCVKLSADINYLAVRILNWSNTQQTDLFIRDISIIDDNAGTIVAKNIYTDNLASIFGLFCAVSGGVKDPYNKFVFGDYPGRTDPVGFARFGSSNVYIHNDVANSSIYLEAAGDYIRLTPSGIALKASVIELDTLATKLYAPLEIHKSKAESGKPLKFSATGTGIGYIGIDTDSDLIKLTSNLMTVNGSILFGAGDTTLGWESEAWLKISRSGYGTLRIGAASTACHIYSDDILYFGAFNTAALTIDSTSIHTYNTALNVAIGTTDPAGYKVRVHGSDANVMHISSAAANPTLSINGGEPHLKLLSAGVPKGYVWANSTYFAVGAGSYSNSLFFDGFGVTIGDSDSAGYKLRVIGGDVGFGGSFLVNGQSYLTGIPVSGGIKESPTNFGMTKVNGQTYDTTSTDYNLYFVLERALAAKGVPYSVLINANGNIDYVGNIHALVRHPTSIFFYCGNGEAAWIDATQPSNHKGCVFF